MRTQIPGASLLAILLAVAGSAQAHGPVNAAEVETLVLADELSDLFYATGGYDLGDFYVGEAHVPGLGDGFYVHTLLFGSFEPTLPLGGPATVRFQFESATGARLERGLGTSDGATFTSDFDALDIEVEADQVEVLRAFVLYDDDFRPGATLQTVRVQSLVADDLRDVAPGGVLVPNSQGLAEIPMGDSAVATPLPLVGPTRYVKVGVARDGDLLQLHVESLLQEGDQHVLVDLPDGAWHLASEAPTSVEVKAKSKHTFSLRILDAAPQATTFDVRTDIGGRVPVSLALAEGQVTAATPEGQAVLPAQAVASEAPAGPWALLVLSLLGAALLRRR